MSKRNILVTGGAGFIGVHTAGFFLEQGEAVTVYDNFSRPGTEENVQWLREKEGDFTVVKGDVTDYGSLLEVVSGQDVIVHLAAQVAVTTSVREPRADFEDNALGSFNVLEAARNQVPEAILVFASTNKVYGGMEEVEIVKRDRRYTYRDYPRGIPETMNLDFHSPYGCSKGAADQYFRDYHRIYDLKTVVLRQSCIYGTHQFGIEDQGWVSWFTIAAMLDKPITIFGDGMQVRDVLFVDDLVKSYDRAIDQIEVTAGQIYNIGGGSEYTLSLLELLDILQEKLDKKIDYRFEDWRPGDQPVYISDIRKAKEEMGWEPSVGVRDGTSRMIGWIKENRTLIEKVLP